MNTTTGFKFLSPNQYVNTTIFCPSFAEYRQEKIKKYVRVSTETIIQYLMAKFFTHETINFSSVMFQYFLEKKKNQHAISSQNIFFYGVVNMVKLWDFENHPTRVFFIHVFYRTLKLFMVFVFRLPSKGVLARVFFLIWATFTLETILELHQNCSYFLT